MLRLLDLIAPKKSADSNIITPNVSVISYGQEISQVTPDLTQKVLEWLFLSLLNAGYVGKAHLFWLDSELDRAVMKKQRQLARKNQPVFLYRCDDRTPPAPEPYYWRMMTEHWSMRIYQLEVRTDD